MLIDGETLNQLAHRVLWGQINTPEVNNRVGLSGDDSFARNLRGDIDFAVLFIIKLLSLRLCSADDRNAVDRNRVRLQM